MSIIMTAVALAAAQAAPAAPANPHANHAQHGQQHQQGQHAHGGQHQGEHNCCRQVDGKQVCTMMQGHGGKQGGHGGGNAQQGHDGHRN